MRLSLEQRYKNLEIVLKSLIMILVSRGFIQEHTRDTLLAFLKEGPVEPTEKKK